MNAEPLAIILSLIAILGTIGTYSFQKYQDRRNALIEMRRTAYREYLDELMQFLFTPEKGEETDKRYALTECRLLIVASDEVIKCVSTFRRVMSEADPKNREAKLLSVKSKVADICIAMRADCFEKTNLTSEQVQALVPIG